MRTTIGLLVCAALTAVPGGCTQEEPKSEFWNPPPPPKELDARSAATREAEGPDWDLLGLFKPKAKDPAEKDGSRADASTSWDWDMLGVTKQPPSNVYNNPVYERRRRRLHPTWWEQVQDDLNEIFAPKPDPRTELFPELNAPR